MMELDGLDDDLFDLLDRIDDIYSNKNPRKKVKKNKDSDINEDDINISI